MSRPYASRLREEQAETTRLRVVEAVTAVLGRGISELTYPAVAEEAGVSLATVQRLFPRKRDLIAGLADQYNRTVGNLLAAPASAAGLDFEGFLSEIRAVIERTSRVPSGLRAAVASEAYQEHRREGQAKRVELMGRVLKPYLGGLTAAERRHVRNLTNVLASSAGVTAFADLAGADATEAADAVAWMLRRLLEPDQRGRRAVTPSRNRPPRPR